MTTTERPERSVPKPQFTDAEAGAREFPDSSAARPSLQLLQARQAQADPLRGRHRRRPARPAPLPVPGLDLRLRRRLPRATRSTWTKLKAWGVDKPEPENGPGTGSQHVDDWPAHGWHEFRDPNEEWELTIYRYNANVVRQVNQNIENARKAKAFEQWTKNWVQLRRAQRRRVDAHRAHPRPLRVRRVQPLRPDEHAQHRHGREQRAQDPLRAGPRALQPHPLRGDRRLRRRGAHRRVEQRRRVAGRPQGHRGAHRGRRRLGRVHLRHQHRVRAAARRAVPQQPGACRPPRATATTSRPTVVGAGEYDYSQRDLRWTQACFGPLAHDREFADHNKQLMQGWLSHWVPQCLEAARSAAAVEPARRTSRRASRTPSTGPRTASPESCPISDSRPRRS